MISRRALLAGAAGWPAHGQAGVPLRLTNVTESAGLRFRHITGAYGRKHLPETMGPGCAFLDYDNDGWQDILIANGTRWPGQPGPRGTLALYRNNRNGTFADVTRQAGLDLEAYGLGVAVGDYNNDGFPDVYLTCLGQSRLLRNTGRGTFEDVTAKSGLGGRQGFSTSALWFDYDRDGRLDLFVCNYVRWSPDNDVYCSLDGKRKSYCTPEAYRGTTCWLFRNRGDGTFEDVTAAAGLFDATSKSLGVAMLDDDGDGWPDLFVANDTQPNKLYRNQRNGTFREVGVAAGVAFSDDGKARAGMGVDAADYDRSGRSSVVVTNFDNEMAALFHPGADGYRDVAMATGLARPTRRSLGFGCFFFDADLDGRLDLLMANGHIDDTVRTLGGETRYAQPPQLFLQADGGRFRDVTAEVGGGFELPRVARGAAYGDFDNDNDLDVLLTTNGGAPALFRNDVTAGNRGLRVRLVGTKSNRDGIGATVQMIDRGETHSRLVKTGSSYLSQSELPVTFGLGRRDTIERLVVRWPSGRTEEFKALKPGTYVVTEGKGITAGR